MAEKDDVVRGPVVLGSRGRAALRESQAVAKSGKPKPCCRRTRNLERCSRAATVQHGDRWYCTQHAPKATTTGPQP